MTVTRPSTVGRCFWLLMFLAPPVAAEPLSTQSHSHEAIRDTVRAYLASEYADEDKLPEIEVGKLDSRLRVRHCPEPLKTFLPAGGRRAGATTVGVRCDRGKRWTLYVPVKIRTYEEIVVAVRALPRRAIIGPSDVKLETREVHHARYGYLTQLDQALGQSLRRPIAAGKALRPEQIESQQLVRRGQRVTILARTGNLEVRLTGEALMSGAVGERIRIKNASSERIIEGVVQATGLVRVTL